MKNVIILIITAMLLMSCNICRVLTKSDRSKKKEDTKTETSRTETEKQETIQERTPAENEKRSVTEVEMLQFNKSELPADIRYAGNIFTGKRWNDRNGENILILTMTGIKKKKVNHPDFEEYINEAELFGYHYVGSGNSFTLLWKINDFVNDCPLDLTLDFIPGSLSITDLNDNGIAESTFLYKLACRGDVSPSTLKLIMHENDTKYALRGDMLVRINGYNEGGNYKVDKSFDSAPGAFLDFAKSQWMEFRLETFR